jgi:hypothetical protein
MNKLFNEPVQCILPTVATSQKRFTLSIRLFFFIYNNHRKWSLKVVKILVKN